eukprot:gene5512-5920_t
MADLIRVAAPASTNCQIERLPFALFPVLKTYLVGKDYGNLMNCCRSNFEEIKFGTIRFHFSLSQNDKNSESTFLKLQSKVKDSSKQISISLYNPSKLLPDYLNPKQPPYKVKINWHAEESVDFNIFNNIHHVSLEQFRKVKKISSGFENVKILEIFQFPELTEISNINQSQTLESIAISDCLKCSELNFPMEEVASVIVTGTSILHLPPLLKLQRLVFSIQGFKIPIPLEILQLLLLPSIERANIVALLPSDCDFSVFQKVPDLTLSSPRAKYLSSTPFLPFYGNRLELSYVTLSLWANSSFDFLQTLELENCKGLIDFTLMQNLKRLIIIDCKELTFIPTLPKLSHLYIQGCGELHISPNQPSLHTLEITDRTTNLPNLSNQTMRSLILRTSTIKGDTSIGKVIKLEIFGCGGITSLANINLKSLPMNYQATVKLSMLENLQELGELGNLDVVELNNLPLLKSCEGLHDINTLIITNCAGLTSTAGLRNIRKSLSIRNCVNLTSLVDVEGIPNITKSECRKIHDTVVIECMTEENEAWVKTHQNELEIKSLTTHINTVIKQTMFGGSNLYH